jgi:TonB family protein
MKYIITLSSILLISVSSKGQSPVNADSVHTISSLGSQAPPNNDTTYFHEEYYRVFTKVQQEPTFKGGDSAWKIFQSTHLKYPEDAKREKIQGTVIVYFIVQPDGKLTDINIATGPPKLREAAINLMKESPAWNPAKQNHFIVRAYKHFPIEFVLPK